MRSLAFALCFAISTFPTFSQSQPRSATFEKLTNQLTRSSAGVIDPMDRFGDSGWISRLVEVTPVEKRFFRTRRVGQNQDTAKLDYGGDGSILVGLECNVEGVEVNSVVSSIRPIYFNSGRRFPGKAIGSSKGKLMRSVAKDGYAISGIQCRVGKTITAISVSFARLQPDGMLSLNDTYQGAPIGGMADGTSPIEGVPFCGIYAGQTEELGPITTLAFLVPQKPVRDHAPKLIPERKKEWKPAPTAEELAFPPFPAADDPRMIELTKNAAERVFIVTAPSGKTTGFSCSLDGKNWLALNQQVVAGAPKIQVSRPATGPVAVGDGRAATDQDLIAFAMPENHAGAYEVLPNFDFNCKVGDPVAIVGYDSAGVLKPVLARVRSVEKKLVTSDATLSPEYQGAPVIHLKSGRLIAVAKWASRREFNGDTPIVPPKWSFDRVDSIKDWEPVQWAAYQANAALTVEAAAFTDGLFAVYRNVDKPAFDATGAPARPDRIIQDPRFRSAYALLPANGTVLAPDQRLRVLDGFVQELKRISALNLEGLGKKASYSYFKRFFADEAKVHHALLFYINERKDRLIPPPPEQKQRLLPSPKRK